MEIIQFFNYVKVFHILSVISWMAALFYLPRLFVYHSENFENENFVEVVKIQERKLFNGIATPAMVMSILSGITMIFLQPELFKTGMWIHIKLLFVILLLVFHFSCLYYLKKFMRDIRVASGRFFRFYNEIPTILLVVIVVCVVLRF
ncbi:protoporphyrinogen oxidase HemJ [Helicobacter anatolicus]|uniref:protoporphyrinogen oxidase HemJ n=1 Tax=Helicobacter anatolicus TaxID=2905874 RepID=UPI001E4BD02E|nr:protoporphyrinogen oxidase HemJ [Helicobacter anatolicus]MCE3038356.1 protoporphyrinogen oxidase HemJ [Helicobacter anatolicus]MCE3039225.1 protoporphyrinogen oxidase HemJ [Helicobacter anatolicus]